MSSYTGSTRRFKKKGDYTLLYIGIHSNSGEFHVTLWNLNYVGKQFANDTKEFANEKKETAPEVATGKVTARGSIVANKTELSISNIR